MDKKLNALILLVVVLVVPLVLPQEAFSYHKRQVLGEVDTVIPNLPQTAEGPGLILPDSPLFFLDKIKQNIRLLFTTTLEARARVHNLIARERFAESRVMLARDNETEAENSLKRMGEEFDKASLDLEKAKLEGKSVESVAREINENIKEKYKVIDELSVDMATPFGKRLEAVNEAILRAKVRVEDHLPKHEVERELQEHLKRKIDHRLRKASKSVEELEEELKALDKNASQAAREAIQDEEEALIKAAGKKDEQQRKEAEKRLKKEKKRLERLLEAKEKAAHQARRALEKSREAEEAYRIAHELIIQIENGQEVDDDLEEELELEDELELELEDDIEDLHDLEIPPAIKQ